MKKAPRNLLLVLAWTVVPILILQGVLVYDTHLDLNEIADVLLGSPHAGKAAVVHDVVIDITLAGVLSAILVMFGGYIVSRFITEQAVDHARTHSELAETNARLRTLVDTIPDMVYFKDLEGRHLFLNKACEETFGIARENLIGKTEFDLMPRSLAEACRRSDLALLADRRTVRFEENMGRPDGGTLVLETIKAPMISAKGDVVGLVGVSRDITEHRRLEDQLRQSQKMEAIGRLAGGVAHDINNFLAAITGYCDHIRLTRSGDKELAARIEAITGIAYNASAVVRQLLAFSRKQPMRFEVLNLNTVVQETAKMLGRLLDAGIALEIFLGEGLWNVRGDHVQIEQVLMNLAVNAKDAMADKGTLTVETSNLTVGAEDGGKHPFVAPGDYAVVAVSDTGHGMAPEVRDRIFEPFFTTKATGQGTGLGLSTVYGIVKQHRGYILVFSEPGKGATFRIYMPRCAEGEGAPATMPEAVSAGEPVRPDAGARILLVEDNEDVKGAIEALMGAMGYQVVSAASGEEALRLFERDRDGFSLVVTDVVMPGMRGDEVAVRIREKNSRVKILFISGYTEQAIARSAMLSDSVDFLQKPFSARTLGEKLRVLLG